MTTKERTEKLLELALAQFHDLKPTEQEMLKADYRSIRAAKAYTRCCD